MRSKGASGQKETRAAAAPSSTASGWRSPTARTRVCQLPAISGSSVDARQHRSQPSLPEQPVERASKLRMIPPGHEAATSLQRSIDLCICIHTEEDADAAENRAVYARSVDGGDQR